MSDHKIFGKLFLSIGAMKAGTTWLYAVLERHPELHFTPEKELHYFYHKYVDRNLLSEKRRLREAHDRYLPRFDPERANIDKVRFNIRWLNAYLDRTVDDLWYRSLFLMNERQTYACDFSNLHAHLPTEAWGHILQNSEKLRVLYTMRDPVKRLWSHTKFHLQMTNELHKLENWGPGDFLGFVKKRHIWENAEYGRVLRTMKAALPRENWKAIFYEDIHSDQRGMLRQIEDFLGIAPFDYPEGILSRRFTESVKYEMPAFFPEIVAEDVARIKQEVRDEGFELPAKWG